MVDFRPHVFEMSPEESYVGRGGGGVVIARGQSITKPADVVHVEVFSILVTSPVGGEEAFDASSLFEGGIDHGGGADRFHPEKWR